MVVLITRCSGSDEIPLDRAEQSSDHGVMWGASNAIDNDLSTRSITIKERPNDWVRIFSTVVYSRLS